MSLPLTVTINLNVTIALILPLPLTLPLTLTLTLTLALTQRCQGPHIHHNSLILNSCELTHIGITDTYRSAEGCDCDKQSMMESRKFMGWLCETV